MRVLVTGYNGFIGRHLTNRLLADGHIVFGIDDYSNSVDDFFVPMSQQTQFQGYDMDIDHIDDVESWFRREIGKIDCIFHLAAKARVQPSFENPVAWHKTNVTGTLKLLEFAKVSKIKKFIFSSSSSVYGLSTTHGQSEHSATFPTSPYALQKLQAEQLCDFYCRAFGIQTVCLRYFNVFGENQPISGNYPQLIPILLNRYKKNLPFIVYGDGETRRDFTYVGDVVQANILAMDNKKISGIVNIGSGENYSVNEVCRMIDSEMPIEYHPARNEPKATLAINYKASTHLNWKPTVKLPEWIASQL